MADNKNGYPRGVLQPMPKLTHVDVLQSMLAVQTAGTKSALESGFAKDSPVYEHRAVRVAALQAAIAALEAEQKFPQFSADNWFENWFNRYPADVRKKLSMHDLGRMYDAILEIEFDPSATMDSLLDSSAADQQEKTP